MDSSFSSPAEEELTRRAAAWRAAMGDGEDPVDDLSRRRVESRDMNEELCLNFSRSLQIQQD